MNLSVAVVTHTSFTRASFGAAHISLVVRNIAQTAPFNQIAAIVFKPIAAQRFDGQRTLCTHRVINIKATVWIVFRIAGKTEFAVNDFTVALVTARTLFTKVAHRTLIIEVTVIADCLLFDTATDHRIVQHMNKTLVVVVLAGDTLFRILASNAAHTIVVGITRAARLVLCFYVAPFPLARFARGIARCTHTVLSVVQLAGTPANHI